MSITPPPPEVESVNEVPPMSSHDDEEPVKDEADVEVARPKTIAERMAKLGGIKFGAPAPFSRPPPPPPPPPPHAEEGAEDGSTPPQEEEPAQEVEQTEEDEEFARKQRIAAKIAGMGGMRLGMLPLGVGAVRARRQDSGDGAEVAPASPSRPVPPPRHVPRPPPPPPPVQDPDSEQDSMTTSEDGVKVEAEDDSEPDEVTYEDVEDDVEDDDVEEHEEAPPPVPSRVGRPVSGYAHAPSHTEPPRRVSQPPPVPGTRPPVPVLPPTRRPSVPPATPATRKVSGDSVLGRTAISPPSYVMVDEPDVLEMEEATPPPPPPRPISRVISPPARVVHPPPPAELSDSPGSQWELPSIPTSSLDFGGNSEDLSMSVWSEISHSGTLSSPPPTKRESVSTIQRRSSQIATSSKATTGGDLSMSTDELMATWGRVGVQICEVATTLFEQSKRVLVGDGSYQGFVNAVINQVPNAVMPPPPMYGYVIYTQNGPTVQKRASDIMPGDIVLLSDAKFKGHKGIQTYNQTVGAGEAVVGVVSEFEIKKAKIRVFEANQHVGQQVGGVCSFFIPPFTLLCFPDCGVRELSFG